MNGIIPPAQSKDETNGHICYLVNKDNFLFAPPQIHKGAIDIYREDQTVKCSDAYIVFDIISPLLNKDFLLLILKSPFFRNILNIIEMVYENNLILISFANIEYQSHRLKFKNQSLMFLMFIIKEKIS